MFGDLKPYEHSGKLGQSWWTAPLAGLIVAVVGGFLYAYVDVYSPVVGVITLLVVFGFVVAMAVAVGTAGYFGKCRNPLFLRIVGFATGLLGWYVSWVVFEYALLHRGQGAQLSLGELFSSPSLQWEIAKKIAANGWFRALGMQPKGVVLWTIWGIEALLLVGGTTFLSSAALEDEVFCEPCNEWTSDSQIELTDPEDPQNVLLVQEENLEPILEFAPASPDAPAFIRIKLWECESCHETAAFSIERGQRVRDKDGDIEEDTTSLVPVTLVAPSVLEILRALGEDAELEVRDSGEEIDPATGEWSTADGSAEGEAPGADG